MQESSENTSPYATIPFTKQKDLFEDFHTDQNLVSQMLAYMDIYIQNKMLAKAFKTLIKNSNILKRSNNPAPYNLFMEYYVSNRDLAKVFHVYQLLRDNSVTPDAQTYALLFQTIARMKHKENQEGEWTRLLSNKFCKIHCIFFLIRDDFLQRN